MGLSSQQLFSIIECIVESKKFANIKKQNFIRKHLLSQYLHHFVHKTLIYKIYNLLRFNIFRIFGKTLLQSSFRTIGKNTSKVMDAYCTLIHNKKLVESIKRIVFTDKSINFNNTEGKVKGF